MSYSFVYSLRMGIAIAQTRQRALTAYQADRGTQDEIARLYGISTRTFQRWWRKFKEKGSCAPGKRGHRKPTYGEKDLVRLDKVIEKYPDATLEELRKRTGKSCSIMAVQRAVIRLGYRLKKNAIGQRTKSG